MAIHSEVRHPLGAMLGTLGLAVAAASVHADVTVQQQTSMSLAGINIDIDSVEHTTSDKQRRDSTTQCHGFLSLFCHNVQSGEIVRLDKKLEWQLEPKKKMYTQRDFPTPEERALAQQKLQETMEQMKKCPMPQPTSSTQSAPDTSRCQLSSPQLDIKQTDEHATVAGHDTHKSTLVLSQTCTDAQTGDICEIDYGFDVWLTGDDIPGVAERRAFTRDYLAAQGLDPSNPQLQGAMQQFMAPYADSLKQLQAKAADFKGYPLRTTFYMAFGGPHCGKAQHSQPQQQASSTSQGGGGLRSLASSAISGGLSGLLHHGSTSINTGSAAGAAAAGAANETVDPAANAAAKAAVSSGGSSQTTGNVAGSSSTMVRTVSLTTETKSIDVSSIGADQFEIPTGWSLEPPKPTKSQEFTCPAASQ